MALFSFGKKDKNLPEVSAPVAKTPPAPQNPPKLQTPPAAGAFPPVKPPQPSGLMPAAPMPTGTATTQPMPMPRPGTTSGLKPSRPGLAQTRSTQRIMLPTAPSAKANSLKPLTEGLSTGRINLPIGMILRCLPAEVLAADVSQFESNGMAAQEIGLPLGAILGQLPSGKVEIVLQDLVPLFPPGFLQPTEAIASYLPNLINLPLMDVVMRIPPDLLALRPDQKDVDAAVINMADPFTEEILREQAEAARRQSQPNIIEESQAPQEEFVPRDQVPKPSEPAAPIISALPTPVAQQPAPSAPAPLPTRPATFAPPMPPVSKLPTPTKTSSLRGALGSPVPQSGPLPQSRTISATDEALDSARATTPLPVRPQGDSAALPPKAIPPTPPVPRQTGTVPAPPPPRHTSALPVPTRATSSPETEPASTGTVASTPSSEVITPGAPDASADDLQRLAALAMAQLGEDETDGPNKETVSFAATPERGEAEQPLRPSIATPTSAPIPVNKLPNYEGLHALTEPLPMMQTPTQKPPPPLEPAPANLNAITDALPQVQKKESAPLPVSPKPFGLPKAAIAPPSVPTTPTPAPVAPAQAESEEATAIPAASVAFNLNTCTADDLVKNIPGCFQELAESIVQYRTKIGSFKKLEDLLDVPGITKAAYANLTGETPPENRIPMSLNELLGFKPELHITLKDVTDRIACWPDVTGCLLSQSTGLSLVGTAPEELDKAAIVAFVPRMFESINKSFSEISGNETDALVIPTVGTSYHLFRNKDLYLIILSRLPQMPERHVKVARFVLAALSIRTD